MFNFDKLSDNKYRIFPQYMFNNINIILNITSSVNYISFYMNINKIF